MIMVPVAGLTTGIGVAGTQTCPVYDWCKHAWWHSDAHQIEWWVNRRTNKLRQESQTACRSISCAVSTVSTWAWTIEFRMERSLRSCSRNLHSRS